MGQRCNNVTFIEGEKVFSYFLKKEKLNEF